MSQMTPLYKWKLVKTVHYTEDMNKHPEPSKIGDLMFTKEHDDLFPNREHWSDEGLVEVDLSTLEYYSSVTKRWWTPA
jgi:hypothetical protein